MITLRNEKQSFSEENVALNIVDSSNYRLKGETFFNGKFIVSGKVRWLL